MADNNDLIINIEANSKKAEESLTAVRVQLDQLTSALSNSNESMKKTEESLTGVGAGFVKIHAAIEVVSQVYEKFKEIIAESVGKYEEVADGITRLGTTLELIGDKNVEHTTERFEAFSKALERNSTVNEDVSIKLLTMAKAMGRTDDQAESLVRTSANLSAVTHTSVESVFERLIQTFKGVTRGVSEYDNRLRGMSEEQAKNGEALKLLDKDYAGFAARLVNTFGGQATVVKNLLEHTLEGIGAIFATFFKLNDRHVMIEALLQINEFLKTIPPIVKEIRQDFDDFFQHVSNGFAAMQERMLLLKIALSLVAVGMIAAFGPGIVASIISVATAIGATIVALAPLLGTVAMVTAAVVLLGGLLDVLRRNLVQFGDVIYTVLKSVVDALTEIAFTIARVFNPVTLFESFKEGSTKLLTDIFKNAGKELEKDFSAIKDSANKNLSNLDFGLIGTAVKSTTEFIKGFNKELDKSGTTAKKNGDVNTRNMGDMATMSKEGQQALDALAKKVEELRTKEVELSQNVINLAIQKAAQEQKSLDITEKDLAAKGVLAGKGQELLDIARKLTAANNQKEQDNLRKKALDELIEKNKDLLLGVESFGKTQQEQIDLQLERQLELLDKKKEELTIQGLLNDDTEAQLKNQEALLKLGASQAKEKAPTQLGESLKMAGEDVGKGITDAFSGLTGLTDGIGAAVAASQAVVDAIPQMLDSITHLLDSITELPMKILDSLQHVFDSILKLIANILPNLVKAIIGILNSAVDFLKKLPDVLINAIMQIPDLVVQLLDALPDIVKNLIESLMVMAPKIISALIEFMIKDAPKIAIKLAYYLGIELPKAIIGGLVAGLKMIGGIISDLFKGKFDFGLNTKKLEEDVKQTFKKISGASSQLFAVMDLANASKDGKKLTTEVAKLVDDSIEKLKKVWAWVMDHIIQPVIDLLVKAWQWVWDHVLGPIFNVVKEAWMWVWDNVLSPIWGIVTKAFQWVWDVILAPIVNLVKGVFQWVWDKIFGPFFDFVKTVFGAVFDVLKAYWNNILTDLKAVWDGLMKILSSTWKFVTDVFSSVWDGITSIINRIWQALKDIWQTILDVFHGKISLLQGVFDIAGKIFTAARDILYDVFKVFEKIGGSVVNLFKDVINTLVDVVKKFVNAAGDFGSAVWEALKKYLKAGVDFIEKIGSSIWDGLKSGLQAGSKVFGDMGTNIWEAFKSAFKGAGDLFSSMGTKIWEALKSGVNGLGDIIKRVFDALNPSNLFEKIFKPDNRDPGTVERALGINVPFVTFAKGGNVPGHASIPGDSEMNDRILALLSPGEAVISRQMLSNPTVRALVDAIMEGKISPPKFSKGFFSQVGDTLSQGFNNVVNLTPEKALDELKKGAEIAEDALKSIDPRELWKIVESKVNGAIMDMFAGNHFSTGGYVGSDTVPALLTPGEFVMNRGAVNNLGLGALHSMNAGGAGASTINYNIELPITIENNGKPVDANWVRQNVLPTIQSELKRASLEGRFVVSSKGIRNA